MLFYLDEKREERERVFKCVPSGISWLPMTTDVEKGHIMCDSVHCSLITHHIDNKGIIPN